MLLTCFICLSTGRGVMLEQPRKTGTKVISHMLASHGGEIFIHCIPTARSVIEDPPSISEGLGGRVTDYRIPVCILLTVSKIKGVKGNPPIFKWFNSICPTLGLLDQI